MAADNLVAGGLGHRASADFSGSQPRSAFGGGAGSKHAGESDFAGAFDYLRGPASRYQAQGWGLRPSCHADTFIDSLDLSVVDRSNLGIERPRASGGDIFSFTTGSHGLGV